MLQTLATLDADLTCADSVYDQLEAACLPLITAFHNDLLVHDLAIIADHPGVPFLHWTRDTGTTIVMLTPAAEYPGRGVRVPYLFGTADRWHIVSQVTEIAAYHLKPSNDPARYTCHHWDGSRLRRITVEQAVKVAAEYRRGVESGWTQENRDRRISEWA